MSYRTKILQDKKNLKRRSQHLNEKQSFYEQYLAEKIRTRNES